MRNGSTGTFHCRETPIKEREETEIDLDPGRKLYFRETFAATKVEVRRTLFTPSRREELAADRVI